MLPLLFISGCASYSNEELVSLDYGEYPTEYQSIVQGYFNKTLKDPMSAVIQYRAMPSKVWQNGSVISTKNHGWGVCVSVNAKNSFGAYTGFRLYGFLIRDGRIVQIHGEMQNNTFDNALAQAFCKQLGVE